jgi:hypothetical protein
MAGNLTNQVRNIADVTTAVKAVMELASAQRFSDTHLPF